MAATRPPSRVCCAGLGTHLTLDLAGQAKFGPDAEWVQSVDYTVSWQATLARWHGGGLLLCFRYCFRCFCDSSGTHTHTQP